jgi:response regulator of citrate/malate metabolism
MMNAAHDRSLPPAGAGQIRVLVVEDDPIAAEAHTAYVGRVPGFTVSGTSQTGADALRQLAHGATDLVLLDMNLPDMHGMEVCRAIRASGRRIDVIAVTSARDLALVRTAVSQGVVQYVLKPFVFAALRDRLERYAGHRAEVTRGQTVSGQAEVDRLLGTLHTSPADQLPKGMIRDTLEAVIATLQPPPGTPETPQTPAERTPAAGGPALSAGQVGELTGMSRVTARRYLEHLCDRGLAQRATRYGGTGRPEIEYRWRH